LFGLPAEQIDVLVHPQSVIHGMVECHDGSVVAQLGVPDLRIPIAHCLAWPHRMSAPTPRLDLAKIASLTFEEPDLERFPALKLARQALENGGGATTVLNAANEVAVEEFIAGRLGFAGIARLVAAVLDKADHALTGEPETIDAAIAVDHVARSLARDLLPDVVANAH
jgi:1-deoxy-D-xylulose-5-phosphate reductoisomerase